MITDTLAKLIKDKGISVKHISKQTGISYQILCNCFDEKKTRQLKADEFIKVCNSVGVNFCDLFSTDVQ